MEVKVKVKGKVKDRKITLDINAKSFKKNKYNIKDSKPV